MMKRAQIIDINEMRVTEDTIPTPPPSGLVVKTSYCGVCHSDMHQLENFFSQGEEGNLCMTDFPGYAFPITPGHEISGVVHSMGSEVSVDESLEVGDSVAVFPWIGCRRCGFCRNEKSNMCRAVHLSMGSGVPGGYASYVIVPEKKFVIKLPSSIPARVACMLPCSALTGFNAVTTALPIIKDAILYHGQSQLLIIGAGGLGLWATQFAKLLMPSKCKIIVADTSKDKLASALDRGCDEALLWDPKLPASKLVELSTKGGPYNAIIDFVNNSTTAETAFKCLAQAGLLLLMGLFGGQGKFSLPQFVLKSRQIRGFTTGSIDLMKELVSLVATNELIPPPLELMKLEDVSSALNKMKQGKVKGRFVIDFTQSQPSL